MSKALTYWWSKYQRIRDLKSWYKSELKKIKHPQSLLNLNDEYIEKLNKEIK